MEKGPNMKNFTNSKWTTECRACVLMANPLLGNKYIQDAEGEEGEEYWMQFESISDVLLDLQLYSSFAPKAEVRNELHKRLDVMVDHLEFVQGDQVTEMCELRLKAGETEELVILSKDYIDEVPQFFSEIFIQYNTVYSYDPITKQKQIVETDTMFYHDDGSSYSSDELQESGIDNPDSVRVWKSLDI